MRVRAFEPTFTVDDIERSMHFYTDILGFQISDRNPIGMVFLRNRLAEYENHVADYYLRRGAPVAICGWPSITAAGRPLVKRLPPAAGPVTRRCAA